MSRTYRIVTRKSKLALKQTQQVIDAILAVQPDFKYEIIEVLSAGCYDRFKGNIAELGGKGAFVKDLELALIEEKADLAMHSMKDVPTDEVMPKELTIPAMLPRADIRDVVVCREGETFEGLKEGAIVGTSSVRRASQIRAAFPHLTIEPLRGNVDTRLQKLADGEVDAAVLAKAGLDRLGLSKRISTVFEPDMMMPSAGQGAVGVQCRANDDELRAILEKTNHKDTFTCVTAERAMLEELGGDCHTPIAGYCEVTKGGSLRLLGLVAALDGSEILRTRHKMPYDDPRAIGKAAAEDLLAQGAKALLCPPAA